MDPEQIKKSMRITAIVIIITIGNVVRISASDNIRTVTALSFITMGVAIGIFLVNFFQYLKLKRNS